MNVQVECMCLECGISLYLAFDRITLEQHAEAGSKIIKDLHCTECGGPLILVGGAGDEPKYRLE